MTGVAGELPQDDPGWIELPLYTLKNQQLQDFELQFQYGQNQTLPTTITLQAQ